MARACEARREPGFANTISPDTPKQPSVAGQPFNFFARDFTPGRMQRWRVGVQRELTSNMVVEFSLRVWGDRFLTVAAQLAASQ